MQRPLALFPTAAGRIVPRLSGRSLPVNARQGEQGRLRRTGEANRRVRRGPDTSGDMQPGGSTTSAVFGEALCAPSIQVTVGHQGAVEGNAYLAAVRMPRDDQIVAVVGHRVDHPTVRRMRNANRDIDLIMINWPSDLSITILIDVSVVGPAEAKPDTLDFQRSTRMRQVDPAGLLEAAAKIMPRQRGSGSRSLRLGPSSTAADS